MRATHTTFFLLLLLPLAAGVAAQTGAAPGIIVSFELFNDSPLMGLWWVPAILAQKNGGEAQDGTEPLLTLQPGDDFGYTHGAAITVRLPAPAKNSLIFGLETRLFSEPVGPLRSDGSQDQHFVEETALSGGYDSKGRKEWYYLSAGAGITMLNDRAVTPLASGQQRLLHDALPNLVTFNYLPGDRGLVFDPAVRLQIGIQDTGGIDRMLRKVFPGMPDIHAAAASGIGAGAGTDAAQRFVEWNGEITLGAGKRANPYRRRVELNLARTLQWRPTGGAVTDRVRLTLAFRTVSLYLEPVYLTRRDRTLFHFDIQERDRTGFVMGMTWYL